MSKFRWYNYLRRDRGKAKDELSQPHEVRSQEKQSIVMEQEIEVGITNVTNKKAQEINVVTCGGGRKVDEISKLLSIIVFV